MRNLILSLAIVLTAIINVSAQDTLVTNVRNIVKGAVDVTERMDYKIVVDQDYKKVTFIGNKKKPTFEITLTSLDEDAIDGDFRVRTFNTNCARKLNIFTIKNNITVIAIENSPEDVTYYMFSQKAKTFPKAK
jgi:hypothetical protein